MIENLFLISLILPFCWISLLGVIFFTRLKVSEGLLSDAVKYFSMIMAITSMALFVSSWMNSPSFLLLDYQDWISIGDYQFKLRFIVDLLGATYSFLSSALIGIIFKYSRNYLHREEGYFRFVFLLSILLFGLQIVSFSRSLDLLFAGWELVGTTSVMLIGYFYTQNQPVRHSVKAIISYRICDMGILAASAWAHHFLHSTDFVVIHKLVNTGAELHFSEFNLIMIGLFIIWGSLAKAGQLPMSSWLPTAMEGPTPSSAIFYGALSVHLGPFLLIRCQNYLQEFPSLQILIGVIGFTTAIYASMVGRTRSDAKTMLAYATMAQVGLIYVEIALGFTNFALFHIVANASMRTYQFLRSASLIQDFFENPTIIPNQEIKRSHTWERFFSSQMKKKIFIHALHGFHLDYFSDRIIYWFCAPFKFYLGLEKKWMDFDQKLLKKLLRKN